jgi:hypothetical protein
MSHVDFSSWPREQEATFAVYEATTAASQKKAWTVAVVSSALFFILAVGICVVLLVDLFVEEHRRWITSTLAGFVLLGAFIPVVTLGLIGHSAMYGPQAAFFSELFGTRVRYSGASLGYQLASPLAGGLAPLIATALLVQTDGKPWPVALYLIGMAAITIVSVWLAEETNRKTLEQE